MIKSESIAELATALSAAQSTLRNASDSAQGHGYKYAKLVQYVDIAKQVLPAHGLSVTQLVGTDDNGRIQVETVLMHSSGQYIAAKATVPEAVLQGGTGKNPVQVAGSQITYMRRYQYAAILGMSDGAEDDDAQGYIETPKPTPPPLADYSEAKFDQNVGAWTDALVSKKMTIDQLCNQLASIGCALTKRQVHLLNANAHALSESECGSFEELLTSLHSQIEA